MSNFIETFKRGKEGKNFGLSTGISVLDMAINGLQRKMTIGLAAAPKCGKTTFADYAFIIQPYLDAIKKNILHNVEWIYYSLEIDRVSKEFKFASFFMAHDYKQDTIRFRDKIFQMNPEYLMGKMVYKHDDGTTEQIPITSEHEAFLKLVYTNRIIPLFGEYDTLGRRLAKYKEVNGVKVEVDKPKITFIEEPENPTGINKYLIAHARLNGTFLEESYTTLDDSHKTVTKKRIVGYTPNNPDKYTIVVTDHIRKLRPERGFSTKQNIDKYLEYTTFIRNICEYTFIHIIHSNRNMANVERLKFHGEFIFPTADDVKDSGNPAEECTVFMTLFNPSDEKYNIEKHMGVVLKDAPYYRSLHITESRNTQCPVHMQLNMYGGINTFESL